MPTSINSLLSRMSDPAKQDIDRKCVTMLYGPPGGGKTTLAIGQAQQIRTDEGLIAYVDSAEGWVSLDNAPSLKENVIRLPYQEKSDLFALAEGIKRKQGKLAKVEVVVIDELSSIADDILDSVVRERTSTPKGEALPEVEGKDYRPMGDQPSAIAALDASLRAGNGRQTLLGVTGSGKTYTMAKVIEAMSSTKSATEQARNGLSLGLLPWPRRLRDRKSVV